MWTQTVQDLLLLKPTIEFMPTQVSRFACSAMGIFKQLMVSSKTSTDDRATFMRTNMRNMRRYDLNELVVVSEVTVHKYFEFACVKTVNYWRNEETANQHEKSGNERWARTVLSFWHTAGSHCELTNYVSSSLLTWFGNANCLTNGCNSFELGAVHKFTALYKGLITTPDYKMETSEKSYFFMF